MRKRNEKHLKRTKLRRLTAVFMAAAMTVTGLTVLPAQQTEAAGGEYEIYPAPQNIQYTGGDYIINGVNVVYEDGIDEATQARLEEALALKPDVKINVLDEPAIEEGKTTILVGIDGSDGFVDKYAEANSMVTVAGLFEELDAYMLDSKDSVITVLGADTDASFYGLTTLYHILKQMDSYTICNFHIEDWADVASRGFIEGYYGNPWSTQDRINLMTWGGYYKLNAYFYAPKDDAKHRTNWNELYTPEEIESLIRPLAEAGNASKCRFVYALHPFPSASNHLRFDGNYETDLGTLKEKFKQVIDAGVRQIAILADDFWNPGGENGLRLINDVTDWLETEVKAEYPDMKTVVPYVPYDYMGNGSTAELQVLKNAPENVQIVMTGGRVWGEVTDSFTSTFTSNVGRGPFMWINWPCTDNSKKHLIMGGYTTFLHPGVNPANIQGIMLNPMQQSEPSKVAIFGNACYSWNIWESEAEADQAWNDSFKYVDHNSAIETQASNALRELSKHMINQAMDSRVTALQESVELAPKLTAFREKLNNRTVTEADVDSLIEEFKVLQNAADIYEAQAGDANISEQIIYWLDCWDDTTDAAIAYLNGVKAVINNNTTEIIQYNTEGKTAFDNSKTHAFWYVDHNEYAEVGVQHIVPFIQAVAEYVSKYAEISMNPDAVIQTITTNRTDSPVNGTDVIFDGNDGTFASYRTPNYIYKHDYIGVLYNKVIDINDFRFRLGNGKNHFYYSKFQYTMDGQNWQDIPLTGNMDNQFTVLKDEWFDVTVSSENLPENFQAMGIRLIATAGNPEDSYLDVYEIQVNRNTAQGPGTEVTGEYSTNRDRMNSTAWDVLSDGSNGNASASEVWLSVSSGADKDKLPEGSYLQYTFSEAHKLQSVHFAQGGSASGDVIINGSLQYLDSNEEWQTVANVTNATVQTFDLADENITTTAVRILNNTGVSKWWRVGEFRVETADEGTSTPIQYNIIKTDRWTVHSTYVESNLYDGNENTFVWYDPDGSGNSTGDDFMVDDYLGYDFGTVAELKSAHIVVGAGDNNKIVKYAIETSVDNENWTPVSEEYREYTGVDSGKDILDIDLTGITARYIRIRNLEQRGQWGKFSEFTVEQALPQSGSTENLYTNVETSIGSDAEEGKVSLTSGTVVLNNGDYIGVDLVNIKSVTSVSTSALPENIKLQTSMNGIEWSDYTSGSDLVDARYVRMVSSADSISVALEQFEVSYEYVGEITVQSDFGNNDTEQDMRTAGTVGNVFDGNLSTLGMITGLQNQGLHITFDLGRVIDFDSIRYYIIETQLNYLRDAVFEVSVDGQNDWQEVLHVGETVTDNTWNESTAKDAAYLIHDSSNPGYMYAEAVDLNVSGRYIRVTPQSTYSHRWAGFSEIQINGGAYISAEVNKDIISEAVEENDKIPSNMLDGDYSTVYKSSEKNSSFTYRISDPEGVTSIRLVQLGQISSATVTASYIDENGEAKLGTLSQAVNEFIVPDGKTLKSITVTWEDVIPEIAEVVASKTAVTPANKDELGEALENGPDTSSWTTDSIAAYEKAKAAAQEVYENENASQTIVDSVFAALTSAINNAVQKALNITELQALVDGMAGNDNNIYTNVSYSAYENAINNLAKALENADNLSQSEADTLAANVEAAQNGLVYSTRNRELAEVATLTYNAIMPDNYTTASYQALTDAKTAIDNMAAEDKAAETAGTDRVNPQEFIDLRAAYQAAVEGLVDVSELKAEINKYESLTANKDLYTTESWTAYENAVNAGKALLDAGTQAEVNNAVTNITNNTPVLKPDIALDEAIQSAEAILNAAGSADRYTTDSFNALASIVEEAKANQADSYIQQIQDAMNALVNVEALKAQITAAQNVNPEQFTTSSYKALTDLLGGTDALLRSGSAADVAATAQAIENAIRTLEPRATGVQDYVNGITLRPETGYTAESYRAYMAAYNALKNADVSNLSAAQFAQLRQTFEQAELGLMTTGGNVSNVSNVAVNTGDTQSMVPVIVVLILCVAVAAAVIVIRKKRK